MNFEIKIMSDRVKQVSELIRLIRASTEIVNRLIQKLHQDDPENITFEQLGILDGQKIIEDFLNHGEPKLAFDHLLYVIHESNIVVPPQLVTDIHTLAAQCHWNHGYTMEIHYQLRQNRKEGFFNVPNAWKN